MLTFATANISLASIYTNSKHIDDTKNMGIQSDRKWAQDKMKKERNNSAAKETIEKIHKMMDADELHCIGLQELTISGHGEVRGSVPMILEQFGFDTDKDNTFPVEGGKYRVYTTDDFCFVIGIINLERYDAIVGILFNKKILGKWDTVKLFDSGVEPGRPILIVNTKKNYRLVTFHGANPSGGILQKRLIEKFKEKKCIFYIKEEAEVEAKAKAGIKIIADKEKIQIIADKEKIQIIAEEADAILDEIANDLHDKIFEGYDGQKLVIMSDTNDMHYEPFGGVKKEPNTWQTAQNWSELDGICERLKEKRLKEKRGGELTLPQFEKNTPAPCCYNYNSIKGKEGKILDFLSFKPNLGVLEAESDKNHLKGEYGFYSDVILHHGFKTEPKMGLLMDKDENDKLSDHRFIKLTLESAEQEIGETKEASAPPAPAAPAPPIIPGGGGRKKRKKTKKRRKSKKKSKRRKKSKKRKKTKKRRKSRKKK